MIKGNCKVRFVCGKRGSGKTLLARNQTRRIDCRRILYYDSNGHDYKDGVICNGLDELKRYWRRVIDGDFRIVYRSTQPRRDFPAVCRLVMAAGSMLFVVDEVDMYFTDADPGPEFGDIIRRGRHEDIELIGITQRPRAMGEIRSQAHELYIFETHEPSDLAYFKQSFSDVLIEKIKALREYEYVKVILPYDESALEICREAHETDRQAATTADLDQPSMSGRAVGLQRENSGTDLPDQQNPMEKTRPI
jgi:hypothetical protein